jgi:hypothetical protein
MPAGISEDAGAEKRAVSTPATSLYLGQERIAIGRQVSIRFLSVKKFFALYSY